MLGCKYLAASLIATAACGPPIAAPTGNRAVANAPNVLSDSTLAILEPDHGACVLRRVDPIARTAIELGRFPNPCFGARVSWRADLRRALVWFDPENLPSGYSATGAPAPGHPDEHVQITEHRYELDLATHMITSITPPATDHIAELAYGADGSLFAFAERELPNAKGVVTVEGRVLDFTHIQEGLPAAAIAYRHDGDAWTLVSATATTTGWDYARGWSAAPEASHIGPRSNSILEAHAATKDIADPAIRHTLDQIAPSRADGDAWAELAGIYVWMFNAEFVYTTGRIAWRRPDGSIALLPELGFTGGELVSIASRGRYLLVAGSNTGAYPRLYDLVEQKRVYASETARAITFWPLLQ